jgi:gluconate 2-dehydrogenase gamma chain
MVEETRQGRKVATDAMADLSRRAVVKGTSAVGATLLRFATATEEAAAQVHREHNQVRAADDVQPTYLFFNVEEAAFIEAAVARLIPKDDQWAGVPNYIDKQLAGAWASSTVR